MKIIMINASLNKEFTLNDLALELLGRKRYSVDEGGKDN